MKRERKLRVRYRRRRREIRRRWIVSGPDFLGKRWLENWLEQYNQLQYLADTEDSEAEKSEDVQLPLDSGKLESRMTKRTLNEYIVA